MIKSISNVGSLNFKGPIGLKIPAYIKPVNLSAQTGFDTFVKSANKPSFKTNDISFGYNFELKNPSGIPCAYCGKEVLSRDDLYKLQELSGKDLVNRLEYFASQDNTVLPSQYKGALKMLEKCALDYPERNGETILPIAYTRSRNKMIIKQASVYSKIEKIAQELNSKELQDYIKTVKEQDAVLNREISVEDLSDFLTNKINVQYRKDVIKKVRGIIDSSYELRNNKKSYTIFDELSKLPSSKNDPDAFLVKFISKALRKDPKIENELVPLSEDSASLFYSKLLFGFASSAEHIKAYSDEGRSHFSNYLVTHVHCNCDRGNEPWVDYMLKDPNKFDYVINNLETIVADPSIAKGLKELKVPSYIRQVTRQLVQQSQSARSNPDVKKFIENLNTIHPSKFENLEKKSIDDAIAAQNSQIRLEIFQRLSTLLSHKLPSDFNKAAQSAIESAFQALKFERMQKYKNVITHLPDSAEADILKDYFTTLRINDPIIGMKKADASKLKEILSDSYNEKYKKKIASDLALLFPDGIDNFSLQSTIDRAPRRFALSKQADGLFLKILVSAKIDDENFDRDKIASYNQIKKQKNSAG